MNETEMPDCFGSPTQESDKCNKCKYLDKCVAKLWEDCGKGVVLNYLI